MSIPYYFLIHNLNKRETILLLIHKAYVVALCICFSCVICDTVNSLSSKQSRMRKEITSAKCLFEVN